MKLNDLPTIGIIRRSGEVVPFNPEKIRAAVAKAFLFDENGKPYASGQNAMSAAQRDQVDAITDSVTEALLRRIPSGGNVHIEDIQDQVELALMRMGEHKVARGYVLFRQARANQRAEAAPVVQVTGIEMLDAKGNATVITAESLLVRVEEAVQGLEDVSAKDVAEAAFRDLYNGVPEDKVSQARGVGRALAHRARRPDYAKLAARLLMNDIRQEVLGEFVSAAAMQERYISYFPDYIRKGIDAELLDERLAQFDLEKLAAAIKAERDGQFEYLGLQTLYDRYFLHIEDRRIELPQIFFMRVAMGLAINEVDREKWAIEFYNVLSTFDYMSSTPTLFNAGTRHSQLSSCYLTTISDDLDGIYQGIKENALLQKYAGGLGNDWTNVRAMGARIKGTNGKSQGVIPFLKVVNDTAVAVNQGGKRKGAVCGYLETWHMDIEEFLELRKNTGDDRRRTHDMNTANWIPDLFMKRVVEGGDWTLFSPNDVPDLHDKYGKSFEEAYTRYEEMAKNGEIKLFKTMPAVNLWRKMLTMLFETGHPWITFKDPCNIRSPQQHVGVVHSSNLCTEITLNTSDDEIAVCNLGSVNLVNHLDGKALNLDKLRATVRVAMRMLDNVIDINYYAVGKARNANLKHRPVGLGMMGFQDALQVMGVPYASERAVEIADSFTEALCFYAYEASSDMAVERGRYSSFKGSLWDRGTHPVPFPASAGAGARRPVSGLPWHRSHAGRRGFCGLRLGFPGREDPARRHAQFELCGHRAHGDDCQHRGGFGLHRADLPEPLREIQPVGGIHHGQQVPGEEAEGSGHVGSGDGERPQVLRWFAGQDRPGAAGREGTVRDRVRDRAEMAGRVRRAPAEVDRPGPKPEHLHGRGLWEEAGRALQARLGAWPQDHVLPAHAGRHLRREIDGAGRRAECRSRSAGTA